GTKIENGDIHEHSLLTANGPPTERRLPKPSTPTNEDCQTQRASGEPAARWGFVFLLSRQGNGKRCDTQSVIRPCWGLECMPRRLSRPARQVWRFGKAFASTGAERTKVREHPRAAKTKPKPKIAGRAGSLRYRGWIAV